MPLAQGFKDKVHHDVAQESGSNGNIVFAATRQTNVFCLLSPLYLVQAPVHGMASPTLGTLPLISKEMLSGSITDTQRLPSQGILHLLKLTMKMNYPEPGDCSV